MEGTPKTESAGGDTVTRGRIIGSEHGDMIWLAGHVEDRTARRTRIDRSEWVENLTCVGRDETARDAVFVWMVPGAPDPYWNSYWREVPQGTEGAQPWTRMTLPHDPMLWL